MVLLKNDNDVLPLTEQKYKKIAVFGEYATKPLVGGQGSAEVVQKDEYTDSPLAELQKLMPNTEFHYIEGYKKDEFTSGMSWLKIAGYLEEIGEFDVAVCFLGSMLSEDTEKYDRLNAKLNQNFTRFILEIKNRGKKVVAVLQNGGALVLDAATKKADAILEMWLGGEAAGGAVSDVLCGVVNPSGKLPETFPTKIRTDLDFPGNGMVVEYKEKLDVGYRYYDKHPEEIVYPFGHGLSYTSFEYKDICVSQDLKKVECTIKNIGDKDGKEIVQLYIGDPVSTVVKPIKELKKFKKVFLKAGEEKKIVFELEDEDFSYYNVMLHEWVVENGKYDIRAFSTTKNSPIAEYIVYTADPSKSISTEAPHTCGVVTDLYSGLNADDEPVYYMGIDGTEYEVEEGILDEGNVTNMQGTTSYKDANGKTHYFKIEKGDLIRYGFGAEGAVSQVQIVYDANSDYSDGLTIGGVVYDGFSKRGNLAGCIDGYNSAAYQFSNPFSATLRLAISALSS